MFQLKEYNKTKQNLTEMKNAFYRLIRGLDIAEEEIREYEDMSV